MAAKLPLLPYPRSLVRHAGFYSLPRRAALLIEATAPFDPGLLSCVHRLQTAAEAIAVNLEPISSPPLPSRPDSAIGKWQLAIGNPSPQHVRSKPRSLSPSPAPPHPEGYSLRITSHGIGLRAGTVAGLRAAVATLRQLLRAYGRRPPCLSIRDYPDFPRRGVMLDISRGRVPKLQTLLDLTDHLADFKINEFQLYTEHTFAYRNYRPVWRGWGALTGAEIRRLDAHCRELGIDLVPNQNSFGHLRYWLAYPPLKKLAEVSEPYEDGGGAFLRYPSTLAPTHPRTLHFLRELYDELLPHFSSARFNVGCDETWDLGRGQSKRACATNGKGRVYLEFLKKIHREVTAHGRQMMFWGDIILHYPKLLRELPRNIIALNWGYEADHPFERETALFAKSGLPFYVCPGTSTWMTLLGRHDNALANLRRAANAGRKHSAQGYLITDWGDGGHPQPLAVSYLPYLAGAALSWSARTFDEDLLVPVLSRDIFHDATSHAAKVALALGLAHQRLHFRAPNVTPLGAVIAAPPPKLRELFCRDGLKYFARIKPSAIRAALNEVDAQRKVLSRSRPRTAMGKMLATELELAARMAAQSCKFMLWQQARAEGKDPAARRMAEAGVRELQKLDRDFRSYWPSRNKGTTQRCSPFLRWRVRDYQQSL